MLRPSQSKRLRNAGHLRFAIVTASYNERYTRSLLAAARATLAAARVPKSSVRIERVPGSFEIPVVVSMLARSGQFDAVIAQGCIIQGETDHARLIAESVAHALQRVAVETGVPCIFGIVTAANEDQARARCLGRKHNRGTEAARTAIEMAALARRLRAGV